MGLTIHYKGALKEAAQIEPLAAEVMDIAEVMNWSFYRISHPSFDGIMLIPEGCEPVQLTFDADGKLVSGIALMHGLQPGEYIFTKTQYAGMEVHKAIVRLLRYLEGRYFESFEMVDDGGYWEHEAPGQARGNGAPDQVRGDVGRGDVRGDGLLTRLEGLLAERRA
jgi:hypothetical protein